MRGLPGWAFLGLVADHLWQSTLVLAGIAVLVRALSGQRAAVRHALWCAASIKFLVPFSLLVAGGRLLASGAPPVALPVDFADYADVIGQPFAATVPAAEVFMRESLGVSSLIPSWICAIWMLGCVAVFATWFFKWLQVAAIVRTGSLVSSGRALDMWRRVERGAGIGAPIALISSTSSHEPGVFGILQPVLLWPETLTDRLDDRQLEAILAHEISHVRRRDNLIAAVQMVVESVLWFYPPLWWLEARLVDERERACDEAVIVAGHSRRVYAEGLLTVCQFCLESPLPCVAGVSGANLRTRVEDIMNKHARPALTGWPKSLLIVVAFVAVGVPISVGALATPRQFPPAVPNAVRPAFEVASVKANKSGDTRTLAPPPQPGGRYTATNIPLDLLIALAYQPLQRFEIAGVPDWAKTERFDIVAKAEGDPSRAEVWLMLQSLLADRFKLVAHRESRQLPVYALVTVNGGRTGTQLRRHTDDAGCVEAATGAAPAPRPIDPNVPLPPPPCGAFSGAPALGRLAGQRITLDTFGRALSGQLGRMVLDRTGLTGVFDLTLEWTPPQPLRSPDAGAVDPGVESGRPSIFTAVQEQLGLRLEPQTGPIDVLVIDQIDRPSPD